MKGMAMTLPVHDDPAIAVQTCFDLAECHHPGPWSAYLEVVRAYLAQCERIGREAVLVPKEDGHDQHL